MSSPELLDGCPACVTEDATAVTEPHRVRDLGTYIHAAYRCPECRHRWSTSWLASALAPAASDQPRRSA